MNKILKKLHTKVERMGNMEIIFKICLVFVIIGAINWGLIGLFDFNLVDTIFEAGSILSKVIYTLVGVSGLVSIGILFHHIDSHPME